MSIHFIHRDYGVECKNRGCNSRIVFGEYMTPYMTPLRSDLEKTLFPSSGLQRGKLLLPGAVADVSQDGPHNQIESNTAIEAEVGESEAHL